MAIPDWLDETESRAWKGYVLTRDRLAAAIGRDLARESDLTFVEYHVLASLHSTPQHRMGLSELADTLQWSQSRLSHQITRMERRKLVARESAVRDARCSDAVLTETGLETLCNAAPGHIASVRKHFIDNLDDVQLATLADTFDTLLKYLTGGEPGPSPQNT
ncbi:MarR family winged helix-turn-helix transcriptional regulator [Antrihabitans sp. NCIMB 15449]|uniref:Winged helix-turn-helix transcriptional regulator n=2 Tax=Antrihabitans TaxID=2799491 RepID=A0A934U2K9_9NOCA|nr:MarR family winged helix-turn-helix transcriptional regulator [Antrihabitans stalagmiti]MBJ8338986.1 winged helix-turn-helix transcriptional regulator [Antrihabitans stalagmiti]